jgi:DNA-binding transcriptional LysR family regulator
VTHAGEVLAEHARHVLAAVGSARSAVGAARGLAEGRLTLLTTPCLGAAFLPDPLAKLAAAHPGTRFDVLEGGGHDVERRFRDDGVALAVLPVLTAPVAPGLREQVLWAEPLRAVLPADHRLARTGGPVPVDELVREPLVVAGASGDVTPEVLDLRARRGVAASVAATADCPDTVAALVHAGLGVGLLTEVAARTAGAGPGFVTVPLADSGLLRRVAAYWYDVLLGTDLGRALHAEVLGAAPPEGAVHLAEADLRV